MNQGIIVKALSGFYDVLVGDTIYTCKGRGLFRKQNISPLVGDQVTISLQDDGTGTIQNIEKRYNELIRPPIANVDQAIVVSSIVEPDFNPLLLDRFLVLIEMKEIKPIIVLTKADIATEPILSRVKNFIEDYEKVGYEVLLVSKDMKDLKELIFPKLENKLSVISGQSGVGKSSLLNQLDKKLTIETGNISKSLGRGKHTTRHVELFSLGGGFVADTPGFSALDFDEIEKEELRYCFPEFIKRQDDCKFRGCLHLNEPKCAVKDAVLKGEIAEFRYKHYKLFLEEINMRKPRY
ncbi:ribosome small subunit-dependent GTPase A [Bacillaceae bacterium W0354]